MHTIVYKQKIVVFSLYLISLILFQSYNSSLKWNQILSGFSGKEGSKANSESHSNLDSTQYALTAHF